MKLTWLPDVEPRPRHVAVGEFDGVHLGHRDVIAGADTVLTFEPHPRVIVAPAAAPKLLTSLPVKADLVAGLGVRELVVVPFDEAAGRRAGHGARIDAPEAVAEGTVRLVDPHGLVALAEALPDGTLKPVVGFRG